MRSHKEIQAAATCGLLSFSSARARVARSCGSSSAAALAAAPPDSGRSAAVDCTHRASTPSRSMAVVRH
jgi:hypothetical protein